MDQREFHLQPLGICYRLYHFITKTLASQALKTVTLGRSTRYSSTSTAPRGSDSKAARSETPCKDDEDKKLPPAQGLLGDSISSAAQQAEDKNNPCMKVDEMARENKTSSLAQTKSLKKAVSINDNVEEILPSKKKRRSKSFQKSTSLDQEEEEEEEEPKPLRSILKVGSNLEDKSNSIC